LAMTALPTRALAGPIVEWSWNDGTTQGWNASTATTNVSGRLLAINNGNGSLQIFSPVLAGGASVWSDLSTIRFDVELVAFSGISNPDELEAELHVQSADAVQLAELIWPLDVSNWGFGQTRTFVILRSQPFLLAGRLTPEQILENVGGVQLFFAKGRNPNNSSAFVDNFSVSAVPEPPTIALSGLGLVCSLQYASRRRRRLDRDQRSRTSRRGGD
jgi:hypothetical protein